MTGVPAPGDPPAAVAVAGLTRAYGARRALDRLDLTIPAGEFLTLFGPNGAGKTTLIKILSRLARPTAGAVRIFGVDLHGEDSETARARIGLVGHASFLYAGLTAEENLAFYARMYGATAPRQRAAGLLEELGLGARGEDRVETFSRGMLQRLSIARALIPDPDLLLLDEPYTGLDPNAAALLTRLLQDLHGRGRTILMTSHDLTLGRQISSRFLILRRGRAVLDARPGEVSGEDLARLYRERAGEG